MRVLLVGISTVMNYGCEAIIRGTHAIIRSRFPDAAMTLATSDVTNAIRALADLEGLSVVQVGRRVTPVRLMKGVLRRAGIGIGSPVRMDARVVDAYDVVLSVGGDNFCEMPDGSISVLLQDLMTLGERAQRQKKAYVLWGASVGPFSMGNERAILDHLNRADLILVRDRISQAYLQARGLTANVHLIADPAFRMGMEKCEGVEMPRTQSIGLNLSLLAVRHALGEHCDAFSWLDAAAQKLATFFREKSDLGLVLIPHVVCEDCDSQNDWPFLAHLRDTLVRKGMPEDQVVLLPPGLGAARTKGLISGLHLLIAARMHCCVAGLSSAVPTILIAYSQKGHGMGEYAYGHDNYVVPITQFGERSFFNAIDDLLSQREKVASLLRDHGVHFCEQAQEAANFLSGLLKR